MLGSGLRLVGRDVGDLDWLVVGIVDVVAVGQSERYQMGAWPGVIAVAGAVTPPDILAILDGGGDAVGVFAVG